MGQQFLARHLPARPQPHLGHRQFAGIGVGLAHGRGQGDRGEPAPRPLDCGAGDPLACPVEPRPAPSGLHTTVI